MKNLYTAIVTSKGGRNGKIKSDDGKLDFNVAFPKEMGGTGEGTNPEQLFAAAYASCFEQALLHMADIHKIKLDSTKVTAHVSLLQDEAGGFNLAIKMEAELNGCEEKDKLIKFAHAACPYSKAVRVNIPVEIIAV